MAQIVAPRVAAEGSARNIGESSYYYGVVQLPSALASFSPFPLPSLHLPPWCGRLLHLGQSLGGNRSDMTQRKKSFTKPEGLTLQVRHHRNPESYICLWKTQLIFS